MKKTISLLLLLSLLLVSVTACQQASGIVKAEIDESKPTVYVSVFPMYDFVKKIVSDKMNVVEFMPQGQEPHDWEMTPKDMLAVEDAVLFVYSGAGLEGWVETLQASVRNKEIIFLEAGAGIEPIHAIDGGHADPHVWLSPLNAKIQMKNIADALSQIDPSNQEFYLKNYEAYAKRLDDLDLRFHNAVLEFTCKTIIVPHEAYGYMCKDYGLTQMAVSTSLESGEPSAARMREIIDYIKQNNIETVFYDVNQSPDLINKIAEETDVLMGILNSFEVQIADLDYFSVMEQNLIVLQDAFQK